MTRSLDRVPFLAKIGFGLGSAGRDICILALSTFVVLFYNQVLGLPAHLAGLAVSCGLIFEGILDPIIGAWSDHTRGRLGRRHPFLYTAPFAIVISFVALWNPPHGLASSELFIWCAASISILRSAIGLYEIPQLALGGEMSPNYIERSRVLAYGSFFGHIGNAAMQFIALTFFFVATAEYPRGLLNPQPWSRYGIVTGLVILACLLACAGLTHSRIKHLTKLPSSSQKLNVRRLVGDIGQVLRNRNFVMVLIAFFCGAVMIGMRNALHLYVNTFFWGLTSEQLSYTVMTGLVGSLLAFLLVARLHARFDKKHTTVVTAIGYAIVPVVPVWLGLLGILKPGDSMVLPVVMFFSGALNMVASISVTSVYSLLADIADENELRFGVRQEGVLYSLRAFCGKVDLAIGGAFGTFVLTIIAFPRHSPQGGEIDATILHSLLLWDGIVAVIPGLIAALIYGLMRTSKNTHHATRAALAERKAKALAPTEPVPNS